MGRLFIDGTHQGFLMSLSSVRYGGGIVASRLRAPANACACWNAADYDPASTRIRPWRWSSRCN
jgi:hypothetical protein